MAPRDFVRNIRAELSPPLLCCFLVNVVRNLLDNTIMLSKFHALNICLLVWSVSSHCVRTFHKYHLMSVVFGFGMPLLSFDASARSFGRCRLKVEFFHFRNQNVVNNFFLLLLQKLLLPYPRSIPIFTDGRSARSVSVSSL